MPNTAVMPNVIETKSLQFKHAVDHKKTSGLSMKGKLEKDHQEMLKSRWIPRPAVGHGFRSSVKKALQSQHATTEIKGGEDNLGIVLHHLPTHLRRQKELLILEKKTAYRREYCLCRQLLIQQGKVKGSPLLSIFPRIFDVDISFKRLRPVYHLYMEFLPESPCLNPLSLNMLEELARCSIRLNTILPELSNGFQLPPQKTILSPENYSLLRNVFSSSSGSIIMEIIRLDSFLSNLPLTFAHADLYWNNVRLSRTKSGTQLKIIDFAWARQLPIGVEWHHFAVAARNGIEDSERFRFITDYYSSILGINPRLTRASATLFALHVALSRCQGPKGRGPITLQQADAARHDAYTLYEQAFSMLIEV